MTVCDCPTSHSLSIFRSDDKKESKHVVILQQKVHCFYNKHSCVDCFNIYRIIQEVTQQTVFYQHSAE